MSGSRRGGVKRASKPGTYRLRWSKRAETDLEEIYDYIAGDDPVAAARWVEKLLERARKAAMMPFTGRVVPELKREDLREVLVRTYRIVYRITAREVQVITVFEGHRLFPPDVDVEEDLP